MRVGELTVGSKVDTSGLAAGVAQMQSQSRAGGSVITGIWQGVGLAIGNTVMAGISRLAGAAPAVAQTTMRYHELSQVFAIVGKNAGYTTAQMDKQIAGLRAANIQGDIAYEVLTNMARSQLDVGRATDLARVAQDAAVISGQDSSQVLDQIIYGIQTQNTEILRTAGIYVDVSEAQKTYAKQLGVNVNALTENQKQQAVMNAVMENGKSIAGAYATAMTEPGKIMRSMTRIGSDLAANVGEAFYPALQKIVPFIYKFGQGLIAATAPGGQLRSVIDSIAQKLGGLFDFLGKIDIQAVIGKIAGGLSGLFSMGGVGADSRRRSRTSATSSPSSAPGSAPLWAS